MDIGPKHGTNYVENGAAWFDHVRIPRRNMLMRYYQLAKDGTYTHDPKTAKLLYGAMMKVRAAIIRKTGPRLARTVTIAVRYCVVRRQFSSGKGKPETPVLDYQGVQMRLLPLVASCYALLFAGKQMMADYCQLEKELKMGQSKSLTHVHAISTGWKMVTSIIATDGME
eukprot:Colp12_sorted_trinity150504_noHs@19294